MSELLGSWTSGEGREVDGGRGICEGVLGTVGGWST